nr:unnamed protein product [Spirometra erinaceieuropaei]
MGRKVAVRPDLYTIEEVSEEEEKAAELSLDEDVEDSEMDGELNDFTLVLQHCTEDTDTVCKETLSDTTELPTEAWSSLDESRQSVTEKAVLQPTYRETAARRRQRRNWKEVSQLARNTVEYASPMDRKVAVRPDLYTIEEVSEEEEKAAELNLDEMFEDSEMESELNNFTPVLQHCAEDTDTVCKETLPDTTVLPTETWSPLDESRQSVTEKAVLRPTYRETAARRRQRPNRSRSSRLSSLPIQPVENTAATCWYRTTFGVKASRCISHYSFTFKQSKRVKPVSRKVSAVNLPDSSNPGRTLYVRDTWSGRRFLVDTVAQLSLIPPTPADRRRPIPAVSYSPSTHCRLPHLAPASSLWTSVSGVFSLGSSSLLTSPVPFSVQIFSPLSIFWSTAVSPVYTTRLPTSLSGRSLPFDASRQLAVLDPETENSSRQLLAKYPGLTRPNFNASIPPHDVAHHIRTIGPFSRPRSLAPARFAAAKVEFEHMLQMGIVRQSESAWASILHMVPKAATGDWRPCGDYRALNNVFVPDRYPYPHHQDFAGALFSRSVFSKIDLLRAFHQILIVPEDDSKTAVTTPFGLYEFLSMPFGLHNASQAFQKFLDRVLRGLPFVYAYIDDLLVTHCSFTAEEDMEHLATVFDRLQQFGVVLEPSNYVFGVPSVEFLGHLVDSNGIHPLPSKVAAMRDFPPPSSKRQL